MVKIVNNCICNVYSPREYHFHNYKLYTVFRVRFEHGWEMERSGRRWDKGKGLVGSEWEKVRGWQEGRMGKGEGMLEREG
jgi:hypothetical protein